MELVVRHSRVLVTGDLEVVAGTLVELRGRCRDVTDVVRAVVEQAV